MRQEESNRNKLQLKKMREYLQNRKLLQFGQPERIEESSYPSKCRRFKNGGGSLQEKYPGKYAVE